MKRSGRSGQWECTRCGDSENAEDLLRCNTCQWLRYEDERRSKKASFNSSGLKDKGSAIPAAFDSGGDPAVKAGLLAPALPPNPYDWVEEQQGQPLQEQVDEEGGANAPWKCEACGENEWDEFVSCRKCGGPRWQWQSFDGRNFFVTRTQLDHDLDCSGMNRLHWTQLLCPPSSLEKLAALFVSGIVDNDEEAEEFARQLFPGNVHAWMVAQNGMSDLRNDDSSVFQILHGSEKSAVREIDGVKYPVSWRALFFKPLSGLMHIKLYLFRFCNTLRVAVCSANPTLMSWSFQRECIWVQDFPVCRNNSGQLTGAPPTEFGEYLETVVSHMRLTANCLKSFALQSPTAPLRYCVDFSLAKVRLVASIAGEWSLCNLQREQFGHLRLRACIREAGWAPENNATSQIACQSGSIGGDFSHANFFDDFVLSLGGASTFDACEEDGASEVEEWERGVLNPLRPECEGRYPANLSIYFPSHLIGVRNARLYAEYQVKRQADIYCTVSSWHSQTYPTACFRDVVFPLAKRADQPSPFCHSKFIFRIVDDERMQQAQKEGQCVAYMYVGSHNFSKTAWGFRAAKKKDVVKCNSFELGVLMATTDPQQAKEWRESLPFRLDAPPYRPDDVPFSKPSEKIGSRYGDPSRPRSLLMRDLLKLGFDEEEARAALDTSGGNGALAYAMLMLQRSLA